MSINGMISMRARLCGIGEATCIKLVGSPRHRVSNRDFDSRRGRSWPESPPPERTGGGVIQNRAADALRHRRVSDVAAGHVNSENGDTASGNMTAARFVGVVRFWSKDRHCFRARDRHRSGYSCLRGFYGTGGLGHIFGWWRLFFNKLRRNFRNRRRFGNGNIFRWRRRLIFGLQLRFYSRGWNIRKVHHRRLVFDGRDRDRAQMER